MTLFSGLGALVPTAAVDVVAVFAEIPEDETFDAFETIQSVFTGGNVVREGQLISDARPLKAAITEEAEFYKHPLENSKSITDHRVIQPVSIDLVMALTSEDFPDVYSQIKQLFLDATPLAIQTRTGFYTNQVIQSIPHEETPELFNGVLLTFSTSQIQFATVSVTFSPIDVTQQSTIDRGEQLPQPAQESNSSAAKQLFDRFFN